MILNMGDRLLDGGNNGIFGVQQVALDGATGGAHVTAACLPSSPGNGTSPAAAMSAAPNKRQTIFFIAILPS